jgi:acetylornithine deacetylase/succinyl-diaminopimelate desuccinylase-like protein
MHTGSFLQDDGGALLEEATRVLREYLRIDTTNPPGNETGAARFLQEIMEREGIDSEVMESRPGRGSLVARLPGNQSGEGPLVLLHHADVVAAASEDWSVDPFGGEIRDGFLYGRGAVDMKSVGILHLLSFLEMKRRKVPLRRDLVLLMVADEEAGGRLGTGWLLDQIPWLQTASLVLDEGGFIEPRTAEEGGNLYCVSIAEKVPIHLELHARGVAGHGSIPIPGAAPARIVTALNRIMQVASPPRVHPVVKAYFQRLADVTRTPDAPLFARIEESLLDPRTREEILSDPFRRALLQDTITFTQLRAGEKINVIPSSASAGIDCRLLPDRSPEAFLQEIAGLVEDLDIRLHPLLSESATEASPMTGGFMEAMDRCVREEEGQGAVLPVLMTGATDGRYFRRRGIPVYGFAPFQLPRQEMARMHGVDERLSLENLSFGLGFFLRLLHRLMADTPPREE